MYLLPQPKTIQPGEGFFRWNHGTVIVMDHCFVGKNMVPAQLLQQCVRERTGLHSPIIAGVSREGDVFLTIKEGGAPQSYRLMVEQHRILVEGADMAGALYGVQTLCQMISQEGALLSGTLIEDAPHIPVRGYFLDQTRGRVSKLTDLYKIVDKMCRYKLNQLHLNVEHTYLFRDLTEMWRDDTPLTAQDILALDAYCKAREIELVPCIASFGHLYKLLSTKTYGHLCELENSWKTPFSFWDRMRHHTVNVSDSRVLPLIKSMMDEFMQLFTSQKFNICADETFDLGKGKSKALADEKGVHNLYIEYVRELCEFLVRRGKTPMFWGDIIWRTPELIHQLPKETICLNWGYAPNQRELETETMAKAGATQYLCPGVCGWNQWMHLIENSYKNISLMCSYARKHGAVGILNTDWGDFGHINQIEFSRVGMIYGAVLSWSEDAFAFPELNRQISRLEYEDFSEEMVDIMAQMCQYSVFQWHEAVMHYEVTCLGQTPREDVEVFGGISRQRVNEACGELENLYHRFVNATAQRKNPGDGLLQMLSVTLEAMDVWNHIGLSLMEKEQGEPLPQQDAFALAERLERWFMCFKELWRLQCKEGDLVHISEIVFWYADLLREKIS